MAAGAPKDNNCREVTMYPEDTAAVFRVDSSLESTKEECAESAIPRGEEERSNSMSLARTVSKEEVASRQEEEERLVSIPNDVYNMFFLSNVGGQGFFYAAYIFILKMTLYTILALDATEDPYPDDVDRRVLIAQFLMLPVAVAMQEDLTATFFLVGNLKFSAALKVNNPDANKLKYHCANFCRGLDGVYSLLVNFVILMKADRVLGLFLNFAALQFLQTIDNIALDLAADGYLTDRLEVVANNVKNARLPKNNNTVLQLMDSFFFISTFFALVVAWAYISYGRE